MMDIGFGHFSHKGDFTDGCSICSLLGGADGSDGMAWGRLNQICQHLQVDPVSLEPIRQAEGNVTEQEKRILAYYNFSRDMQKGGEWDRRWRGACRYV